MSTSQIPTDIEHWAIREFDLRPGSAVREYAGGSRPLWYAESGDHGPVVVRLEPPGAALAGSEYGIGRELEVYEALRQSPVPVPVVLGSGRFDDGQVLVMTRAPGTSRIAGVAPEQARGMLENLMVAIADLHRDGIRCAAGLPWVQPVTIGDAVAAEIDRWRLLAAGLAGPSGDPQDLIVACALAWLRSRLGSLPDLEDDAVLVQGDTGPGNVVFHEGRVSAIVDWELAHLGDPAEDIAWVDQRCASMPAPFGDTAQRRETHLAASSMSLPAERIAYHGVFVRARCAVITGRTVAAGGGALGRSVYEPARHRFRVELADLLLAAVGGDPAVIEGAMSAPDGVEIDTGTRNVDPPSPRGDSPAERLAAREDAVLQAHLRARTDVGEALADLERRDRVAVLGEPGEQGSRWLAAVEAAGEAGDVAVIGQLARSARRDAALWPEPPARS